MTTDLIERVDELVQERSLLTHPFYEAWNRGDLPLESLRDYAGQYFHFEAAYPTFLSGLHHRCDDPAVRRLILDNLWDEEHGDDNHVELWLRFCDALGLDRERVRSGSAVAATESLVGRYRELTSSGPLAPGAAALYAFESQVPAVAAAKIDGLRRFYGMDDDRSVSFFRVHRTLDIEHAGAERQMVAAMADAESSHADVLEAVDAATASLWSFLDGVYESD
jgi:pyrroloquinoline-quinone synthase